MFRDILINNEVLKNYKDVYVYSFNHIDGIMITSFISDSLPQPGRKSKAFFTYINPLRGFVYKVGIIDAFSSEMISKDFETFSFLGTGEKVKLKRIGEIKTKAISTIIPLPIPLTISIYEKYNFKCEENKYNVNGLTIKKIKVMSLPQIITKANYMFVYNMEW